MSEIRQSCGNCKHKNYCQQIREKVGKHFKWTFHNIVGHPISEIAYLLGFKKLSYKIHNNTIPKEVKNHEPKI